MVVLLVLAVLPIMVVVLVLWRMVLLLALGLQLRLAVGPGFGDRLEVEGHLLWDVWGDRSWMRGVLGLLPRCWGCQVRWFGRPPAAWFVAAALAFAVALWMRVAVRGKEEVEDDEEDEDEGEVVVLRDAGCVAMRAWAVLPGAAASAAATAGRMGGIPSGCGLVAGGCKGSVAIRWPWGPTWSAAVALAGLGSCNMGGCARQRPREGTVRLCCIPAPGGTGLGLWGCMWWACVGHWAVWVFCGAWGSFWRVFVCCRVCGAEVTH